MGTKSMKKILCVAFSVVLVLGLMPTTLYAQTPSDDNVQSSDIASNDEQNILTLTSNESSDFITLATDDEDATEQDGEEGSDASDDEVTEDESNNEATEDDSEADADEEDSVATDDENEVATLAATADDSDIQTLAERTEYPDAGIPEIDDLEWGMNLSKSATNLDENYESTVTLNVQHDIDLVIVQDGTNLENATFNFLEDL